MLTLNVSLRVVYTQQVQLLMGIFVLQMVPGFIRGDTEIPSVVLCGGRDRSNLVLL